MRLPIVAKSLGALLLILALGGLGPLVFDAVAGRAWWPWLVMEVAIVLTGGALFAYGRRADPASMGIPEGVAVTGLTWFVASLLAALGIYLAAGSVSFIESWFEAMSGFTTTGATIFGEDRPIEALSPGIKLWRSQIQWMGGIGIVVISLALLPLLIGGSGFQIYRAEVPGIDTDRLAPRIRDTALILFRLYFLFTFAVFLTLVLCGVSGFHALCHSLTTVATGGFSTFDDSIEGLESTAAEWVIIAGMLLGGINFGLLLHCLRGRPTRLWASPEVRLYLTLILGTAAISALILGFGTEAYVEAGWHDLIRDCLFQAASIGSSTGYATGFDTIEHSWTGWPAAAQMLLVLLMIGGGCAGSTAGGVKLVRFLVAWKAMRREFLRFLEPARVVPIHLSGQRLNDAVVLQVGTYLAAYVVLAIAGSFLLALLGSDLASACSAAISCLSNIGPAIGEVGAAENWSHMPPLALVICIMLMLIGRLEIIGVLLLLRIGTWRR